MKTIFSLILCVLLLSSCAKMFNSEVVTTVTDEFGEVTESVTTAAVARDELYMERGNTRDKYTKDMYATEGFTLGWQQIEETVYYPGMEAPLTVKKVLPTVTYKAPHVWQDRIETKPPDHRGWASLDKVGDNVLKGFLYYLTFGVLDNAVSKDTQAYQGDYITGSYNPTTSTTTNPYVLQ